MSEKSRDLANDPMNQSGGASLIDHRTSRRNDVPFQGSQMPTSTKAKMAISEYQSYPLPQNESFKIEQRVKLAEEREQKHYFLLIQAKERTFLHQIKFNHDYFLYFPFT